MIRLDSLLVSTIVIAMLLSACSIKATNKTQNKKDKVSKFILNKEPDKLSGKINADFDGKVTLIGYSLKNAEVLPGDNVEITWYWKCNKAPGPGWRLFTHMLDGSGNSKINRDGIGAIRKNFQPEHWSAGMIIEDRQNIKVPKSWKFPVVELRVGLWNNDDRMKIKTGPRDTENRIKGPRISVIEKKEARKDAVIPYASKKPLIDGSFESEPAWRDALVLDRFYHTLKGTTAEKKTVVRLMWDEINLYVAMTAEDEYLQSKYTKHDDELWHEDAFEIFIDPKGNKKHYFELQISPKAVMFDSYLPAYRKNHNEWSSETKSAVAVDGTVNDSQGGDTGWSAELAIPFASMKEGGGVSPVAGDTWNMNFFRIDVTQTKPRYSAWSPPLRGDFHALDKFRAVEFAPAPVANKPIKSDAGNEKGASK